MLCVNLFCVTSVPAPSRTSVAMNMFAAYLPINNDNNCIAQSQCFNLSIFEGDWHAKNLKKKTKKYFQCIWCFSVSRPSCATYNPSDTLHQTIQNCVREWILIYFRKPTITWPNTPLCLSAFAFTFSFIIRRLHLAASRIRYMRVLLWTTACEPFSILKKIENGKKTPANGS